MEGEPTKESEEEGRARAGYDLVDAGGRMGERPSERMGGFRSRLDLGCGLATRSFIPSFIHFAVGSSLRIVTVPLIATHHQGQEKSLVKKKHH